jgi:hypothetical protein
MSRRLTQVARSVALLCASIAWLALYPRLSPLLLFGLLLLALLTIRIHRRWSIVVVIWGLLVVAPMLPIDIAFDRSSGLGPRIMPVAYGLLSAEGEELAKKGLIWPGGCIVFPNSPRWVLVL